MVSAWAAHNRLILGQVKTEAKSNEITAIPELLKALDIRGCIVTIDAMGCQKEIAEQIIYQGANYITPESMKRCSRGSYFQCRGSESTELTPFSRAGRPTAEQNLLCNAYPIVLGHRARGAALLTGRRLPTGQK